MTGSNPTDRGKLDTKRHVLTVKKYIPLSVVISSSNSHDIKLVTNVIDNRLLSDLLLFHHKVMMKRKQTPSPCLDKVIHPNPQNKKLSKEGICSKYLQMKEETKQKTQPKDILQKGGWWREPIHGTTGSGNCSQDM